MVGANVEAWMLTLVPILVVCFLGVLGWVLKQAVRLSDNLGRLEAKLEDQDARLIRLEGWQESELFGRRVTDTSRRHSDAT